MARTAGISLKGDGIRAVKLVQEEKKSGTLEGRKG